MVSVLPIHLTSDMQGMIWGEPELSMHCYGMYGGVELVLSVAASLSCCSLASLSSLLTQQPVSQLL